MLLIILCSHRVWNRNPSPNPNPSPSPAVEMSHYSAPARKKFEIGKLFRKFFMCKLNVLYHFLTLPILFVLPFLHDDFKILIFLNLNLKIINRVWHTCLAQGHTHTEGSRHTTALSANSEKVLARIRKSSRSSTGSHEVGWVECSISFVYFVASFFDWDHTQKDKKLRLKNRTLYWCRCKGVLPAHANNFQNPVS